MGLQEGVGPVIAEADSSVCQGLKAPPEKSGEQCQPNGSFAGLPRVRENPASYNALLGCFGFGLGISFSAKYKMTNEVPQ